MLAGSYHLPVAEMTANLHPLWNPGSMPRMDFPRTGGVSKSCFKLAANTATEAFSAVLVSSDLATNTNTVMSSQVVGRIVHFTKDKKYILTAYNLSLIHI